MRQGYVYILASQSRVLYIGVTSDLEFRVQQHRAKEVPGFTSCYNVTQLVWFEQFPDMAQAIAWEKKLKGWTRAKKISLVEEQNPFWEDLAPSSSGRPQSDEMLRSAQHDRPVPGADGNEAEYA